MEEWDSAINDFVLRWHLLERTNKTSMSKLSIAHRKNIIAKGVCLSMIYAIVKSQE
jgi:hypothetical protein